VGIKNPTITRLKSLCSKAVAGTWGVPLLRMDIGRVMNKWVGGSEANMRAALTIIEALSPCCLWIDEIEKSLSGVQSSSFSDSGTFARVFSTLLTWCQEHTNPVFLVATCNAMIGSNNQLLIPPELHRKGRFDGIFFVGLPTIKESIEIFRIHISKPRADHKGRNPDDFDLEALASIAYKHGNSRYKYTGAEIEAAWLEAMYSAFYQEREPNTDDVIKALHGTIPISYTMKDTMDRLLEFGTSKCMLASTDTDQVEEDGEATPGIDI